MSSSHSEGASFVEHDATPSVDAVELTVPDLGAGHDTATVVAWAKFPGDLVASDEAICRLAVDDLQFDVHATADGELHRVLVEAGGSVRGGDSLAQIAPRGEPFYASEPLPPGSGIEREPTEPTPQPEPDAVDLDAVPEPEPIEIVPDPTAITELAPPHEESEPQPAPSIDAEPQPAPPAEGPWPSGDDVDWSRWHSPVVRMLAAEHGVDLSQVEGTGAGGRIRKRDVLAHVEGSAPS